MNTVLDILIPSRQMKWLSRVDIQLERIILGSYTGVMDVAVERISQGRTYRLKISKKTLLEVASIGGGSLLGIFLLKLMKKDKVDAYIDFDNTITRNKFSDTIKDKKFVKDLGLPRKGCKAGLKKSSKTVNVVIWSCRTSNEWNTIMPDFDKEEQIKIIKGYMKKHNLPYDRIETKKDKPFGIIICDQANKFVEWKEVPKQIKEILQDR